jgi:hypothetical protein
MIKSYNSFNEKFSKYCLHMIYVSKREIVKKHKQEFINVSETTEAYA